jgi:hypothetical protein
MRRRQRAAQPDSSPCGGYQRADRLRGRGGVSGDIIVGDADGVVVVPLKMAADVARAAAEQEQLEAFLTGRIREGAALPGTYPPNETTRAAFEEWKNRRKT